MTRFVLISDLTPRIINNLGSTFWMNPEFFEVHLNASGYHAQSYEKPPSETWGIWGVSKPFVSLRWWRPVLRQLVIPFDNADRNRILYEPIRKTSRMPNGEKRTETYSLATNIFRQEIALVSDAEFQSNTLESEAYTAAWEERVTLHYTKRPDEPGLGKCHPYLIHSFLLTGIAVIVLLDPAPKISVVKAVKSRGADPAPRQLETNSYELFYWPHKRVLSDLRATLNHVFNGNPFTRQRLHDLYPALQGVSGSTFDELSRWLEGTDNRDSGFSMILEILRIASQDTCQLIERVYTLLNEIEDGAMTEHILQRRLLYWRRLLNKLQRELEAVNSSLHEFGEFVQDIHHNDDVDHTIRTTMDKVTAAVKKIEAKHAGLRADFSLLENKRGISQAESVGRLTELGFIFLPISCVASAFSMQIQELSNPVPVGFFILASSLVILAVYSVRLSVRSSLLTSTFRSISADIRKHCGVIEGNPITTRAVLQYALYELIEALEDRTIPQLILLALLFSPIVLVWTKKDLDTGYKMMILLVGLGCIFPFALFIISPHWKEWLKPYTNSIQTRRNHVAGTRRASITGSNQLVMRILNAVGLRGISWDYSNRRRRSSHLSMEVALSENNSRVPSPTPDRNHPSDIEMGREEARTVAGATSSIRAVDEIRPVEE